MDVSKMTNSGLYEVLLGRKASCVSELSETQLYGMENTEELAPYGLGESSAGKILAAVELGKRLSIKNTFPDKPHLSSAPSVATYLMPRMRYKQQEEFWVLCLNSKNNVIASKPIFKGSLNSTTVHPREVFKYAVLNSASVIIVAHNHPSGDIAPSKEDIALTKQLKEAAVVMGIPLVDHVIIGDGKYYSFEEEGRF